MMTEKQFEYGETDLFEWVEVNGKMISTKECVNKLNKQQLVISKLDEDNTAYMVENLTLNKENNQLKEENKRLKKKLESLQKVLHLVECVNND